MNGRTAKRANFSVGVAFVAAAVAVGVVGARPALAQSTWYYDTNGTAPGFGVNFTGTWNGTSQLFNSDPTGGSAGTLTGAPASTSAIVVGGTGGASFITISGTQQAASLQWASATATPIIAIPNNAGLLLSGSIFGVGASNAQIRLENSTEARAAQVLGASSVAVSQLMFSDWVGGSQFLTTNFDIAAGLLVRVGAANAADTKFTVRQTGGLVQATNANYGIVVGGANNLGPSASGTSRYILDSGTLAARWIGNGNVNGNNNATNSWSSAGSFLEFNAGTIRNVATDARLEFVNGSSFETFISATSAAGRNVKDMQFNTSRPLTIELGSSGSRIFEVTGTAGQMVVTPSAQIVDKQGGAGSVAKTGLGDLVFTGNGPVAVNSWTGDTTVNSGRVVVDYNQIAGQATSGSATISNGYSAASQLVLNGGHFTLTGRPNAAASTASLTLPAGSYTVTVGGTAAALVVGQAVTDTAGLLPAGTYVRRILNGTQIELSAMSLATTGSATTLNFAAADFTSSQTINRVSLQQTGTVTVSPAGRLTQLTFGDVSGTGGFVKAGGGLLRLTGSLSYTGPTTVSSGTLRIEPASGTSSIVGAFSGAGTIVKAGAGTTIIGGTAIGQSNSYTGAVIVDGGVLRSGGAFAGGLYKASSFTVNPGATLEIDDSSLGWSLYEGALTVNSGAVVRAGFQGFKNVTLNGGEIAGARGGSGAMAFAFDGNVTVGGSAASRLSGTFGVGLTYNSGSASSRTFTVADATAGPAVDFVVSAPLQNSYVTNSAASLVKAGLGTMLLSGTSTYTGSTTVSAGLLVVNGRLANTSGVSVAAGASLGGTGSIASAVSVAGTLAPGASPGVLQMASLSLQPGSTTLMEIDGLTRGSLYDGINLTTSGGLAYGGSLSLAFGLVGAVDNDTTFDLFNFAGAALGDFTSVTSTGFYAGAWTQLASGTWALQSGNQTLTFSAATGDVVVVPEPTAAVLAASAVAVGVAVRRRLRGGVRRGRPAAL